jgi:hypothetical protein
MFARLTLLEIDTLRVDVDSAVALFRREVLPDLSRQPGYAGVLVLTTPTGGAALLSLWETAEAAEAHARTGFYAEALDRYMTMFRSPPGRERYEVAYAELPLATPT